mgnify:CR=1 FL=1
MGKTSIEWADHSVNPIRARLGKAVGHYCEKVSPGCASCYASRMQSRFGMPEFQEQRRRGVEPFLDESKLEEVLRRRVPTRYFWEDMSDLFGAWVPDEWIDRCFAVMALAPQHTHLVLTKRAERMRDYMMVLGRSFPRLKAACPEGWAMEFQGLPLIPWPLPSVWLGVSVEDQKRADERIPLLLRTPAAVRFLSVEPMLERIDLHLDRCSYYCDHDSEGGGHRRERTIDWAIFGGESGPGFRPMDPAWLADGVRQCREAGIAAFVKQDSGPRPGMQGRIGDDLWAVKEFPNA